MLAPMKRLALTPTALSGFLACRHKTALSIAAANGELARPGQNELERKLLELRGFNHEAKVLESFRSAGLEVHCPAQAAPGDSEARAHGAQQTLEAMRDGVDVVYQGTLLDGAWHGRPHFLVK